MIRLVKFPIAKAGGFAFVNPDSVAGVNDAFGEIDPEKTCHIHVIGWGTDDYWHVAMPAEKAAEKLRGIKTLENGIQVRIEDNE